MSLLGNVQPSKACHVTWFPALCGETFVHTKACENIPPQRPGAAPPLQECPLAWKEQRIMVKLLCSHLLVHVNPSLPMTSRSKNQNPPPRSEGSLPPDRKEGVWLTIFPSTDPLPETQLDDEISYDLCFCSKDFDTAVVDFPCLPLPTSHPIYLVCVCCLGGFKYSSAQGGSPLDSPCIWAVACFLSESKQITVWS